MTKKVDLRRSPRVMTLDEHRKYEKFKTIIKHGKEEARLNLRLQIGVHEKFKDKCHRERITMTRKLLQMILRYIDD